MDNNINRRCDIEKLTPIELKLHNLISEVESLGCDVLITDTIISLTKARHSLADFIEKN